MTIIWCPKCDYKGSLARYSPSCADECTCPHCECFFTSQWNEFEDADSQQGMTHEPNR